MHSIYVFSQLCTGYVVIEMSTFDSVAKETIQELIKHVDIRVNKINKKHTIFFN